METSTTKGNADNILPAVYQDKENKVTSAFLQIVQYAGHDLVAYLFGDCDLPSNEVGVISQDYGTSTQSRPDGTISCDCNYRIYVESKIQINALNTPHGQNQLNEHLKLLVKDCIWLLYITPDDTQPAMLNGIKNLLWINWRELVAKLKGYDTNDRLVKFLIAQFEETVERLVFITRPIREKEVEREYEYDDLLTDDERVIIVGGLWGEGVALKYNFYACQPNRFFRPAKYLAFCHQHRIKYLFEILGKPIEAVRIETDSDVLSSGYFADNVEPNYQSEDRKLFRLKRVENYNNTIVNDAEDKNHKPCAFVQKQKYTSIDKFMKATKTSEL